MKFEIIFYDLPNGEKPALEFLLSVNVKLRAKISRDIELLRDNGTALREPYSKPLGDGIFELRTKCGSDISRVLYFFVIGRRIILTNGFIKKSDKTPRAEKEKAIGYMKEYMNRKESSQ